MKDKAIKLITTLLLSVMTLNYIGTTVFAVKYSDELEIVSSLEIAELGDDPENPETNPATAEEDKKTEGDDPENPETNPTTASTNSNGNGDSTSSSKNGPTAKTAEAAIYSADIAGAVDVFAAAVCKGTWRNHRVR